MNTIAPNIVEQILVPHTAFQKAHRRIMQVMETADVRSEPICLALIGESRTGKSRLLENITNAYPSQRNPDGMCVPILKISTPSKPTVKGLVETFLKELGDPLWYRRASEIEKTERLITLLHHTKTMMLIIDEFQHFYDKTSHQVQHHVSDWLKILVDKTRLALVVSGLPSCMAVINQNEQLRGRFAGPLRMPRFDWSIPAERETFIATLDAFQQSLTGLDMPDFASDEIAFRFYCATGGLIGYIAKILNEAISSALSSDSRTITLQDLGQAWEDAIWMDTDLKPINNPFDKDFKTVPTLELLRRAKEIGLAEVEEPMPRALRSKSSKQSVSQLLTM